MKRNGVKQTFTAAHSSFLSFKPEQEFPPSSGARSRGESVSVLCSLVPRQNKSLNDRGTSPKAGAEKK